MSLCQFYQLKAKEHGYNSWNHLCAEMDHQLKERLKKIYKHEFKELKKQEKKNATECNSCP